MKTIFAFLALLAWSTTFTEAGESKPADADNSSVHTTIQRGLEFVGKEGIAFQNKQGCITCHHAPITLWAQRDPQQLGFSIDKDALKPFEAKLLNKYANGKKGPDKNKWRHTLAAYFTLSQPDDWNPSNDKKLLAAMTYEFKAAQQKDGSWVAANQFKSQRRPKGEPHLYQTQWNILAIQRLEKHEPSLQAVREKALKYVRQAPAAKTTDTRAVRVLLEHRLGDPASTKVHLKKLLASQNKDGSWSWIAGEKSDPWATGVVLYVLSFLGDQVDAEKIKAAQSYLANTQRKDGSWLTETKMNPEKHDSDIATYFGTAWSVLGLARTAN